MFVSFFDLYIVISPPNVQFGEYMGPCETVCKVCNEGEWVLILDRIGVKVAVLLYRS